MKKTAGISLVKNISIGFDFDSSRGEIILNLAKGFVVLASYSAEREPPDYIGGRLYLHNSPIRLRH